MQKKGTLKKFDKFLWSPLVAAGLVFLIVLTTLTYYKYGPFWFVKILLRKATVVNNTQSAAIFIMSMFYFFIIFSQTLWLSLIFQILAINKNKKIYLNIAIFFVWTAILPPIILEILVGAIS